MRTSHTLRQQLRSSLFTTLAFFVTSLSLVTLCGCQAASDAPSEPEITSDAQTFVTIPLDEATFPDTMVRNYLSHYYDTDGDGSLDNGEAEAIFELGATSLYEDDSYEETRAEDFPAPTSLQGLELLPSLTVLNIDASNLTDIRLDGFSNLLTFKASATSSEVPAIASIDVSGCPHLKALHISGGCFTSLDLSSNTELTDLSYYEFAFFPQHLESLAIPSSLERVSLANIQVSNLDFSPCTGLEQLVLTDISADAVSLPDANALSTLYISDQNLSMLDLKSQNSLVGLYINAPELSRLDLASQTSLKYLNIANTSVSQIDLQGSAYVNELVEVSEDCDVTNTVCYVSHISRGDLTESWPGSGYLPDDVSFNSMTWYIDSTAGQ